MISKIKILRIINSLDPKYGGPSIATIDSTKILNQNNFDVDIVTSDKKNSNFYKGRDIKIINLGPSIGKYSFNLKLFFWLLKNKHNYEKYIIHGLWQFNSLLARLILKKNYFIFTHGQLDPFFSFQKFKLFKKKIYWFLLEKKNLIKAESILLTSENEKKNLKKTFVDTKGIKQNVINYGILRSNLNKINSIKLFKKKFSILRNETFFIYLGRFHEKKGCDILIKSLKKVVDQNYKIKVLMAGPNNDYKKKLIKLSKKLKLENNIIWSSLILSELKCGAIASSEAMLLASNGENFGVSIVESLSFGKPVITTNKVNIYEEIIKYKSGLICNNNVKSFSEAIIQYINLKKALKRKMRLNAINCFNECFNLKYNQVKLISILKKNNK